MIVSEVIPPQNAGNVALSERWTQYKIDVRGRNLKNVLGGFGWVTNSYENGTVVVISAGYILDRWIWHEFFSAPH